MAGIVLFIDKAALPWARANLPQHELVHAVLEFLAGRLAIGLYLIAGEFIIRKYLWKIERPSLNFSGMWDATTTYEVCHVGSSPVPFVANHQVRVEQDCLSIRIAPTASSKYVNWGSLAIEIAEGNTLRYAYWVNYEGKQHFPASAKGYEEMKVTEYDGKTPIEMRGVFFHCAEGMSPIYSGKVVFVRTRG